MGDIVKKDDMADKYPIVGGQSEQVKQVIEANIGEDMDISPFDLERIKIPTGGSTSWPNGEDVLERIIVAWSNCRGYWPEDFSGSEPPQCSSPDGKTGYGDPGGECKECPLAQFNSAEEGRGQACKAMQRLLLLGEDDWLPTMLTLPPTSLKAFKLYMTSMARQGRIFYSVITEIGLTTETNSSGIEYSTVTFSDGDWLDQEAIKPIKAYHESVAPMLETVPVGNDEYAGEEVDL